MRVCLLGHYQREPTEGTRKIFAEISNRISQLCETMVCDISDISAIKNARNFHPDIVHAIMGPSSLLSIFILRIWSFLLRPKALILTATQFTIKRFSIASFIIKPDLVIVQSERTKEILEKIGWKTLILPAGVDTNRFIPVDNEKKIELRKKFGLASNKKLLLHVGPIKYKRNLNWLVDLRLKNSSILCISRPNDLGDRALIRKLQDDNVNIISAYISDIEKIYQMADLFIFPAMDIESCIETPLSVLEAGSCNLPIMTTEFGSIPMIFRNTKGIIFVKGYNEFRHAIKIFDEAEKFESYSRNAVLQYDWDNICKIILDKYYEILDKTLEN